MNLTYSRLKALIPPLNERIIMPEDIYKLFNKLEVELVEMPLRKRGYYKWDYETRKDYVFIKRGLNQFLLHETLLHEACHASTSVIAIESLLRRYELQAEIFTAIALMPFQLMKRSVKVIGSLDKETYELLKKRLKIYEVFNI